MDCVTKLNLEGHQTSGELADFMSENYCCCLLTDKPLVGRRFVCIIARTADLTTKCKATAWSRIHEVRHMVGRSQKFSGILWAKKCKGEIIKCSILFLSCRLFSVQEREAHFQNCSCELLSTCAYPTYLRSASVFWMVSEMCWTLERLSWILVPSELWQQWAWACVTMSLISSSALV